MSTNDTTERALPDADVVEALRLLAAVIERDGTPGRYIPEQALRLSYTVNDASYVHEFAERHGLTVDIRGEHTSAALPLGRGMYMPDDGQNAVYTGAVVLDVYHIAEPSETGLSDAARRVL